MIRPHRAARFYFRKLQRLRGDAPKLARGVALGFFVGITPTIPLHTISIILLSFPFRASKLSALLVAFMVCNPLTIFPTYSFSWLIGDWLLPGFLSWENIDSIMFDISSEAGFFATITDLGNLGFNALSVLLLGGCQLAAPFALAAYFFSLNFFRLIEDKRRLRRDHEDYNGQTD